MLHERRHHLPAALHLQGKRARRTAELAGHPDAVYAAVYYPEGGLIAQEVLAAGTSTRCLADYASETL